MARIKITGYIHVDDIDPDHLDLDHESGLSEEGYLDLVAGENGNPLSLSDLEDVETERVDD